MRYNRQKNKERSWEPIVASIMARTGATFKQAIQELTPPVMTTPEQEKVIFNSDRFQKLLQETRNRIWEDKATDPTFTKAVLEGQLMEDADELSKTKKHRDAADVRFKLAKVRGYVDNTIQINSVGALSDTEVQRVMKELKAQIDEAEKPAVN